MLILPGFVYIAHAVETPRYKIGRTNNVDLRIESLNEQSCYPIKLIYYHQFDDCVAQEKRLHRLLKEYRVHGEWFELPDAFLTDIPFWFISAKYVKIKISDTNQSLTALNTKGKAVKSFPAKRAYRTFIEKQVIPSPDPTSVIKDKFEIPDNFNDIQIAMGLLNAWRKNERSNKVLNKLFFLIGRIPKDEEEYLYIKQELKKRLRIELNKHCSQPPQG